MTQSSVAVSVDGERWAILNASPDIRAQINDNAELHPRSLRDSPVCAVVLTNGDIDHIAGLLTLREKQGFDVFATAGILDILAQNSVFGVLDPELVSKTEISLNDPFETAGLTIEAFAVPGKIALYLEGETVDTTMMGEQTIGLKISDGKSVLNYIPGCAALPDWLIDRIAAGDMVLFDGTVWLDDEMPRLGAGKKTGSRMGHMSMSGENGSMAKLADVQACKKVYIHINNTNPALRPDGPERREIEAAGWTVACDGMSLSL